MRPFRIAPGVPVALEPCAASACHWPLMSETKPNESVDPTILPCSSMPLRKRKLPVGRGSSRAEARPPVPDRRAGGSADHPQHGLHSLTWTSSTTGPAAPALVLAKVRVVEAFRATKLNWRPT